MIALRARLRWGLLTVLTLGLLVIIARQDSTALERLGRFDLTGLAEKLGLVVLASVLVLALFRERLLHALELALIWVVVGLLLVVGYTYRVELRAVGDQMLAYVAPGRAASAGRSVEITRGNAGEFAVTTHLNGAKVAMVLDTGASAVVLTHAAARAAGLPLDFLNYSVTVETANGRTRAAPVTLDRISVGTLTERSVQALIAQPGQLKTSLLGMSFLNRLESWEVRGDKLLMRGYP